MRKLLVLVALTSLSCAFAAQDKRQGVDNDNANMSSDNGDGTFTNPVIRADYPDPDIIRVGEDYYLVSSSFVCMPGIPICHSKDLINWKIIGHAYDSINFQPQYRMEGGKTAYSRICWAPSFKYKDGIYYIGVNIKDDGFVMYKSDRPEGPYKMYKYNKTLYDPGFFIDDDGKKYVTMARPRYTSLVSRTMPQVSILMPRTSSSSRHQKDMAISLRGDTCTSAMGITTSSIQPWATMVCR